MNKRKSNKSSGEEVAPLYEADDGPLTAEDIEHIRKAAEPMLPKGRVVVSRTIRMSEAGISHITPADGNIFLDLGFEPEEAARLLAESDKIVSSKLRHNRR